MTRAVEDRGYSQLRAFGLVGMEPRVYRYRPARPDGFGLRKRLRELRRSAGATHARDRRQLCGDRRRHGYRLRASPS